MLVKLGIINRRWVRQKRQLEEPDSEVTSLKGIGFKATEKEV